MEQFLSDFFKKKDLKYGLKEKKWSFCLPIHDVSTGLYGCQMGLWMCYFIFPIKSKESPRNGKIRHEISVKQNLEKCVWSTEQKTLGWTLMESTLE